MISRGNKFNGYSADGRRVYYLGGGGGGKQPANTTQTVINDVAPWAREAAKETLAKGMELTNQGYEAYGGERLAGFDPMQQQAFEGAAGMQTAPQLDEATRLAMQSGNYNPADFQNQYQKVGQDWSSAAAQQYMNPYMEAALNPQLRAAARDAQLAQMADQAAAVGRGAFGGSRTAIGQGMREQGLMQNLGDIRAKGYETAYNNAQAQFQADQARRVQEAQSLAQYGLSADQAREQSRQFGSTTGLNAAAQLGVLGQTQFQQGMDINKLRNTYGAQKQAQEQRARDLAYENWAAQKNFDWEQVMRRADLLNRTPTGSSSTTSMYKAGPSNVQQLTAAGTAAAGASQLFAHGGLAYADGGVTSDENVASIVSTLSKPQLEEALAIAQQIGDPERIRVIAEELQSRGGEEAIPPNSISAMATPDMVNNIVPTQQSMANGGIVAFAGGGGAEDEDFVPRFESLGNPELYNLFGQEALDVYRRQKALQAPVALTRAERIAAAKQNYAGLLDMGGPDPYAGMQEKLAARESNITKRDKEAKGLALLAAVPELLQGSNFAEAAGRGIGAAAKSYQGSRAETDRRTEALQQEQYLLAKAQQLEARGLHKEAMDAVKEAEAAKLAAYNAERAAMQGQLTGLGSISRAFRPVTSGKGAGAQPKLPELTAKANYEDLLRVNNSLPPSQRRSDQELQREATNAALAAAKTTDVGPGKLSSAAREAAAKRVDAKILFMGGPKALQKYAEANNMTPEQARQSFVDNDLSDALMQQLMGPYSSKNRGSATPARGTTPKPPAGFTPD